MLFEPIDFQQLNEQDVREEVLAPLLRRLGYRSGTVNSVVREQPLMIRYNKASLGRKKPKTDPILRGEADYICEVEGRIRWVIEAKSPSQEIGSDEIEQAYTYANHPEVRAVYFCVCNGHEFQVYQTNQSPDAPPLLSVRYSEFNERIDEIEGLLSPVSIKRDFNAQTVSVGKPIGLGLRSVVRITSGYIKYISNSLNHQLLNELSLTISGGAIERNEGGQLVSLMTTLSPFASVQRLNEKLGFNRLEVISNDISISSDPSQPTIFTSDETFVIPRGERMLDFQTWTQQPLQQNWVIRAETKARAVLMDHTFKGDFFLVMHYLEVPMKLPSLEMRGEFEVHIA